MALRQIAFYGKGGIGKLQALAELQAKEAAKAAAASA